MSAEITLLDEISAAPRPHLEAMSLRHIPDRRAVKRDNPFVMKAGHRERWQNALNRSTGRRSEHEGSWTVQGNTAGGLSSVAQPHFHASDRSVQSSGPGSAVINSPPFPTVPPHKRRQVEVSSLSATKRISGIKVGRSRRGLF